MLTDRPLPGSVLLATRAKSCYGGPGLSWIETEILSGGSIFVVLACSGERGLVVHEAGVAWLNLGLGDMRCLWSPSGGSDGA